MASGKTENRRINVFLNSKMIGVTPQEMRKEYRMLQNELSKLSKGSAEYAQKIKELQVVNKNLTEHRDKVAGVSRSWMQVKSVMAGVVGAQIGVGLFNKLTSFIPEMIKRNAELSDSFADVMKTTGMSREQVQALSKDLKALNTRTSRKELLELAYVAGKLGNQGRDDVLGFVRAADKITVALGKDLGKDAVTTIGKLVNVFGLKEKFGLEDGMLKIASAMNELGMASEASEGYLAEFMKRLGGVAPLVKMSAAETLALGATLDALGQTSEVSSTALSKTFMKMAKDAESFAKFAGVSGPEFRQMMEEDFLGSFVKVLEGVKDNADGVNQLAATLGELGVDGGRVIGVLGTLANNTERLKGQVLIANQAFEDGTSVLNEFNIKNENLAAIQEKIGKRMAQIWSNSTVLKGVEDLSRAFYKLISPDLSNTMEKDRMALRRLEFQIYDTNTPTEKRIELIEGLKKEYPGLLRNIDAQTVSNKQLQTALDGVNTSLMLQIRLQKRAAQAQVEAERAAHFADIADNIKSDILDVMAEVEETGSSLNIKVNADAGGFEEQVKDMLQQLEKQKLVQSKIAATTDAEKQAQAAAAFQLKNKRAQLEKYYSAYKNNQAIMNNMLGEESKIQEEISKLKAEAFYATKPMVTSGYTGEEPATPNSNKEFTEDLSEKEKAKIKKLGEEALKEYEKLLKDVQKKSDEIFYASLPETDQALIKMDAHYLALKEQAQAALEANTANLSISGAQREQKEQEILDQIQLINQTHDSEMDAYYAKIAAERLAKREQYAEELWLMSQDELDQEIIKILQHFDEKAALYEEHGLDITALVKSTEDQISAIKEKAREEDLKKQTAANKKLLEEQRQVTIQQIQLLGEAANFANEMYTWVNAGSAQKTKNEIAQLEELQRAHANDEAYQKAIAKEIAELRKKEAEDQRMAAEFAITMNTIAAVSAGIAKAMQTSTTIYEAIALGLGMMATVGSAMAQVQALNNNANTPSYNSYAIGTGYGGHSGSMAYVGEDGPERVHMPTGTQVYTASRTVEMAKWDSAPSRNFAPDVFRSDLRNSTDDGLNGSFNFSEKKGMSGGGNDDLAVAVMKLVHQIEQNENRDKRVIFVQKDHDEFIRRDSVVKSVGTLSKG